MMFTGAVTNFTGFAPLGTVLVAMLGVGMAEKSGLIGTVLRKMVLGAPDKLITGVVVFAGVMSSLAMDAGYIVLVPLGAIIFLAKGRHPLAGLAAAFAGVSGGFSSNLLVTALDPLLAGFTSEAAQLLQPEYSVLPTANYFFMIASTVVITIVGILVTERIVEPRLGKYNGNAVIKMDSISKKESKALLMALLSLIVFVGIVLLLLIPQNGVLRSDSGTIISGLPLSPFVESMVILISLFFLIPGVVYGIFAGTIKKDKDVARYLEESMSSMGGYIVLAFVAAQFIAYFNWSNLGIIMSIRGAEFLQSINLTGIPLIVLFILISGFLNLFIGSASAKWAIMAPVFVPMLMMMGYSPEIAQMAYRVGDSVTNVLTPLMPYFAIIVAFGQKYDKNLGIGTLVSMMIPYTIMFTIAWILLLVIWMITGLPIGPGSPITFGF